MYETVVGLNPFAGPKVRIAELKPIEATAQVATIWHYSAGEAGNYAFSPAVVDGTVYVASRTGNIARIDDGRLIWRISAGRPLSAGVGADGRMVVVGTEKGEVLAFSADGKPLWEVGMRTEILSAPQVAGDLVVVRGADSRLYGLSAADGARRWIYQRANPPLTLRTAAGMAITPELVVVGFPGGKLVALKRSNGLAQWESTVAQPKGATELERIADVTSPPVVDGSDVCASAYQGRVACFDLSNGNTHWTRDISSAAGIDVDEEHVYVTDDRGSVHALDRSTGASMWKQDRLFQRYPGKPLAMGSYVAVADIEGYIHVLRRDDGAFAARLKGDDSRVVVPLETYGKAFLSLNRDGALRALAIR